jgi:hypothetical protein
LSRCVASRDRNNVLPAHDVCERAVAGVPFGMIVALSMCAVLFTVKAEQLEQIRDPEWAEQ